MNLWDAIALAYRNMRDEEVLSVFDDRDEREPTGECRRCEQPLYGEIDDDRLCFQCWVRLDKAEAEYIAILTHGGTR